MMTTTMMMIYRDLVELRVEENERVLMVEKWNERKREKKVWKVSVFADATNSNSYVEEWAKKLSLGCPWNEKQPPMRIMGEGWKAKILVRKQME